MPSTDLRPGRPPHQTDATRAKGVQVGNDNKQVNINVELSSREAAWPVPAQLPADQAWFTGRAAELDTLLEIASPDALEPSTVVISAMVDGMAGIGKTALVVHASHRVADRFPDGQIFIDLHGFTQGMAPVEPGAALDRMLRALGVPGERIPSDLDERAAMWRSQAAGRRMLIVLDNAASETQVEPLLPGAPGCLVLVTSRRRLTGLDAPHAVPLGTLPEADAITLFRRVAGRRVLDVQSQALLTEVVRLCGWLPLAIRIAAARLRTRPAWTLTDLVERLRDQDQRLSELDDGSRSVAAALAVSYEHLSPGQQRLYRLLGLHPGPDVDAYAAAALADVTAVATASRLLDQLVDVHLVQEPTCGRYTFHDLVRVHAAHTAAVTEPKAVRIAAQARLLGHYRHAAAAAMDLAYPYERERRPKVQHSRTPSLALVDPETATTWLDTELPNLLAAARCAAAAGWSEPVWQLSAILHRHLRTRSRYRDAETLHRRALVTARAIGHRLVELNALNDLGCVHHLQGRNTQAADHYQQALELARVADHRLGELDALNGLGKIHRLQGRYEQAADHYQQALHLARAIGHRAGELAALNGLGHIHRVQGRHLEAAYHYQRALKLAREYGHRAGELTALNGLGNNHRLQGRHLPAAYHYRQALKLARAIGHRLGELAVLNGLGHIHRLQGRHLQAAYHYRQTLQLAREHGDRNMQFEALQGLGRLQHATGHPDAAITYHEQALTLADELAQPEDQARAHDGLAHACHSLNQHERARRHWLHALQILTRLGVDDCEDEQTTVAAIRGHLADLNQGD